MPAATDHDDQNAIIYGTGRAGSLFSAAKTEDSDKGDVDNLSSTAVKVPTCERPPRIPTPVQQTISIEETFEDAIEFMALDAEASFSPERSKQKVLRKWLLHLHDDILESVKELNNRRLPLRYPGPPDPVKEARDAMIHVEKLLSTGIIYCLPSDNSKEQSSEDPERFNFMYHLMDRQPKMLKQMLYWSFMLSRGLTMYKRCTPEGKPLYKTDGTLKTVIAFAGKVQRDAKRIELEREHQLLSLCAMVTQEAKTKNVELLPSSPHAIRTALEQAKIVGAMKTDVMFGFLDSYLLRMNRCATSSDGATKGQVMDLRKDLEEDIKIHCGLDVHVVV